MELRLIRDFKTSGFTLGRLLVNGRFLCYTCEDTVREQRGKPVASWKVPGKTAIPAGRYSIRVTFSKRFQKHLPLLIDVPGFEGIRIHAGNTADDTEGCILVGLTALENGVGNSRAAMAKLQPIIEAGLNEHKAVFITIGDA